MLKIAVCVKAVPDPKEADKIKIDPITKALKRGDVGMVMNQLDKNAMEAALAIKKSQGAHITVLSMGPPAAGNIVKEALALGGDEGILLSDRAFGGADAYATALTLAKGAEKAGAFDLVLCGSASSDGSTEWVGPQMAVIMDLPVVTMVSGIVETEGPWWKVKADVEDGYRLMEIKLPALLTVTRELNTPKALSFSGIIKARKKEITTWGIDDLGVPCASVGIKGSPTIVTTMATVDSNRAATIIEGTREEKASQLLEKLVDAGVLS